MKHFTSLAVTLQDGIAQVEFNRPERANAIDRTLWAELGTLMQTLDATPSVRVVVLSGRGRHFTAGIDLDFLLALRSDLAPLDAAQSAARCLETILWLQAQVTAIEVCRKPVIAAIHGACLGGGIDISSACDFRYATADARFAVKEIDLAIIADLGTLQRLPRIMFSNAAPSRYVIKRQPEPGCLSTLEATHELLLALDRSGLEHYAQPEQLLGLFQRMQEFQLRCTAANPRGRDRRSSPRVPAEQPVIKTDVTPKRRRIFPAAAAS